MTSAGNAATHAPNVAALFDLFDDRWLGADAADPTVDNDGNALVAGAAYFNTIAEELRVYSGSVWSGKLIHHMLGTGLT
jgi:hypothetical protein